MLKLAAATNAAASAKRLDAVHTCNMLPQEHFDGTEDSYWNVHPSSVLMKVVCTAVLGIG